MGIVLWCVETLRLFIVPLCVGSVLWCVRTLRFWKCPCVWALCCGMWGLWDVQSSPVCGLCVVVCAWRLWFFKRPMCVSILKFCPCTGEIDFFTKNPYTGRGNNFLVCGHCVVVCGDFEFFKVPLCVKLCPCTGDFPLCWRDCFFSFGCILSTSSYQYK